ncbi:sulfatase-like hydrolase/transferase [Pseudoxanthomonas koreensis]|uniref:LTA synthase family protein n=1 Tax=Pseudoxanthomonas koreensis TaxID=266061 RepID=UPI0035A73D4C
MRHWHARALQVAARYRRPALATVIAALWLAQAVLLWRLDRHAHGLAADAYAGTWTIAANALPGWVAALCLVALTRRLLFPLLLVGVVQVAVCIASLKKYEILGSPFALQDVYFLTTINRASLELFGSYVDQPGWWLAGAAGVLAVLVAAFRFERPWMRRFGTAQVALLLGSGLAVGLLYAGTQPWTTLYDAKRVRPSSTGPTLAVVRSGLFSSLAYRHLQVRNMRFEVNAAALQRTLDHLGPPPAGRPLAAGDLPDVVVVLSESFIDPRILAGMPATPDLVPAARALLEAGHGGTMAVPAYGGGTVRTEFEILTGMPADAFPSAVFPYVDIERAVFPSVPRLLKRKGYATVAVHGNSGAFWNRNETYASMGFDRFLTSRDFARRGVRREGMWYSDSGMTDIVLEELDASQGPTFVLAVSMQNHGPYTTAPEDVDLDAWEATTLPAGLDEDAALELRNFLYHLHRADAQLARLHQALQARGRPYVLAFFGDHLPALPAPYAQLGFIDGGTPESQYVPWVLVAGKGTTLRAPAGPYHMHAWELPARILDATGPSDSYFRFIQALGPRLVQATEQDERNMLWGGLVAGANARMEYRFAEHADGR